MLSYLLGYLGRILIAEDSSVSLLHLGRPEDSSPPGVSQLLTAIEGHRGLPSLAVEQPDLQLGLKRCAADTKEL